MEEEQEPGPSGGYLRPELADRVLQQLLDERREILKNEKWSVKEKEKVQLLDTQRDTLSAVTGKRIRIFKSEQIVYAILAFSLVVLLCLAWLTAYANLSKDVTIAFVGTVVGGTTATVAQKLGRL
jgi:hypothetical protein